MLIFWQSVTVQQSHTPKDIDDIVCAGIPNVDKFPELYKTITTLMMHGPCGLANPKSHVWKMENVQKIPKGVCERKI